MTDINQPLPILTQVIGYFEKGEDFPPSVDDREKIEAALAEAKSLLAYLEEQRKIILATNRVQIRGGRSNRVVTDSVVKRRLTVRVLAKDIKNTHEVISGRGILLSRVSGENNTLTGDLLVYDEKLLADTSEWEWISSLDGVTSVEISDEPDESASTEATT